MTGIRSLALAVGWLVAALLFSLGAAGIVTGIGAPQGGAARPELTDEGDRAIGPGLAAATDDLEALAAAVDELGAQARLALAALVATDLDLLDEAIAGGTAQVSTVEAGTAALRSRLLDLPGVSANPADPLPAAAQLVLGPAMRERFVIIHGALEATAGLPSAWARFSSASLVAQGLTTVLLDHDRSSGEAAKLGGAGRYADALVQLDTSDPLIATAEAARDKLAATVDVATLTEWISRNKTYDSALRALYEALVRSKGRVDDEVRAAFEVERAARERLPADTRGLVVILAEIARGGMNQAAIAIEDAAIRLGEAAAAARAADASPSPGASPSPDASPSA